MDPSGSAAVADSLSTPTFSTRSSSPFPAASPAPHHHHHEHRNSTSAAAAGAYRAAPPPAAARVPAASPRPPPRTGRSLTTRASRRRWCPAQPSSSLLCSFHCP
ncbi:unnamed protein product [Urochloa humidicola]